MRLDVGLWVMCVSGLCILRGSEPALWHVRHNCTHVQCNIGMR